MNELNYDCHLYFQSHTISEVREAGEGEKGKVNDTHSHNGSSSTGEYDNDPKVDTQAYLEQKIGTGKIDIIGATSGGSGSGSGSGSGGVEVRATL